MEKKSNQGTKPYGKAAIMKATTVGTVKSHGTDTPFSRRGVIYVASVPELEQLELCRRWRRTYGQLSRSRWLTAAL